MTEWWIDNNGGIHQATAAVANSNAWFGPYPTKAAAEAALHGGTGSSGSGQWWVISSQGDQELIFASQKPFPPGALQKAGPFATKAAADKWIADNATKQRPPPIAGPTGLAAIGDFFTRLGEVNTWIRVAEVLLGLGLIIVGLAKLASGTAVGKAAAKVGETAAIL